MSNKVQSIHDGLSEKIKEIETPSVADSGSSWGNNGGGWGRKKRAWGTAAKAKVNESAK